MNHGFTLHYAPDNASVIVRFALEELGLDYDTTLVDRSIAEQESPEYRAVNPAGLIPAMETPDGVIFETAAILLWLNERTGKMGPAPGDVARGGFLTWLFYVSNTLHANMRMSFYPAKYVGDNESAQAALRRGARRNIGVSLRLFEALAGEGHDWFCGDAPSMLDFYVATCMRWCALYPLENVAWFDLENFPAVTAMAARLEQRPSVQKIAEAEGLGLRPFTRAQFPNPPEGSVI